MSNNLSDRPGAEDAPGLLASDDTTLGKLTQRADYLRAGRGKKVHTTGFVLQMWKRGDQDAPRFGVTCSKKVGNAVARNKAKRRLREIARMATPPFGKPGHDYVLIGRKQVTAGMDFAQMKSDLESALQELHRAK